MYSRHRRPNWVDVHSSRNPDHEPTSRRDFFRMLPLISLAPTVPGFIAKLARAAPAERDGRILVVIQLDGGNDGLNTVVPYGDEAYARNRKTLKLAKDSLIKVSDGIGLHPAMGQAGKLLESGRLGDRSGRRLSEPEPVALRQHGDLADGPPRRGRARRARAGWAEVSTRRRGLRRCSWDRARSRRRSAAGGPLASSLERIEDLTLDAAGRRPDVSSGGDDLAAFVRRSTLDAYASSDRLAELAKDRSSSARYPGTGLADRLKLVARLIKGGYDSRVFYTSQGELRHALAADRQRISGCSASSRAHSRRSSTTWPPRSWPTGFWCCASASSAAGCKRTARAAPTTAPPARCFWRVRRSSRACSATIPA